VDEWEACATGPDGARDGECLMFRADGTLHLRRSFVNGTPEGPFTVYHPDGQVARRGTFVAGRLDGLVSSFTGGAGGEPLRACCVPPGATRLETRYEEGAVVHEVFFDGTGAPILGDGTPWPARPPGVPEDADYDQGSGGWSRWRRTEQRFWSAAGVLVREVDLQDGVRRAERTFDETGELRESCAFDGQQRPHGEYRRRFPEGAPTPFADARIREERGAFDGGQPVGVWTYRDAGGELLHTIDRGLAFQAASAAECPALAEDRGATPEVWLRRAQAWRDEGRVREALCAAARARDPAALLAALRGAAVPLAPAVAAEQGEQLIRSPGVTLAQAVEALSGGTDPVAALRALAGVLPGASRAALDFVEAALLLAPDDPGAHLTRALVRFQHGDVDGMAADLAVVERGAPEAAATLRATMAATFRPFTFAPDGESLTPDPTLAELGAGIIRDLDEVRRVVAVYATRLGAARAAIEAHRSEAAMSWSLPPDVGALLADGPVPLRHERVVPAAAEDEGEDPAPVEIDERLDTAALSVPMLLAEAQADWGALCWLCWSVGLDAVELPAAIAERPLMAVAMKMIVTRCWRAQDQVKTAGLLARSNGVPGFRWNGAELDTVPPHVARAIAEEYLRTRAMFLWLASPDVVSPFQVDLRDD